MNHRSRSQARRSGTSHGVLVLDKPRGPTSHDIVAQVRRVFGTRRVGHAGTLDPMATGVLVVLLGEGTKLSNVLASDRKSYEATVVFGSSTDTLDADGKVRKTAALVPGWLRPDALAQALDEERARTAQMPPQVSAIQVGGKRAYALARAGQKVELEPRRVQVERLDVLSMGHDRVQLRLDVSKGFYVRSLARDLGERLGVPAHLGALRRVASGTFTLEEALAWPLAATVTKESALVPVDQAAARCLPGLEVTEHGAERLRQGKPVDTEHLTIATRERLAHGRSEGVWAAFHGGALVALVETRPRDTQFWVKRGINFTVQGEQHLHPEGGER